MSGILRRYTDVLSLLDILRHNRLTLLSPSRWYDQNDALGLQRFSDVRGEGSVYALCLAEGYEQAHHWQIFAGHSHGVCIQFDKSDFVAHLELYRSRADLLHGPVLYRSLKEVRDLKPIPPETLPFLKRDTFKAEAEYRVVAWSQKIFAGDSFEIPMPATLIRRVILGPTMPEELAFTLKEVASNQPGCSDLEFTRSRLVNNASWAEVIAAGVA